MCGIIFFLFYILLIWGRGWHAYAANAPPAYGPDYDYVSSCEIPLMDLWSIKLWDLGGATAATRAVTGAFGY